MSNKSPTLENRPEQNEEENDKENQTQLVQQLKTVEIALKCRNEDFVALEQDAKLAARFGNLLLSQNNELESQLEIKGRELKSVEEELSVLLDKYNEQMLELQFARKKNSRSAVLLANQEEYYNDYREENVALQRTVEALEKKNSQNLRLQSHLKMKHMEYQKELKELNQKLTDVQKTAMEKQVTIETMHQEKENNLKELSNQYSLLDQKNLELANVYRECTQLRECKMELNTLLKESRQRIQVVQIEKNKIKLENNKLHSLLMLERGKNEALQQSVNEDQERSRMSLEDFRFDKTANRYKSCLLWCKKICFTFLSCVENQSCCNDIKNRKQMTSFGIPTLQVAFSSTLCAAVVLHCIFKRK